MHVKEQELIIMLKNNPDLAISCIKKEYGSLIGFIIRNIIQNPEDILECENDTYLSLWQNAGAIEPGKLKAYIAKTARSKAIAKYRYLTADKRNVNFTVSMSELSEDLADGDLIDKYIEQKDKYKSINDFLKTLSATHRKEFILKYWFGISEKKIMELLQINKSKLESDLFRIRKKLKKYLKEEF